MAHKNTVARDLALANMARSTGIADEVARLIKVATASYENGGSGSATGKVPVTRTTREAFAKYGHSIDDDNVVDSVVQSQAKPPIFASAILHRGLFSGTYFKVRVRI